MTNYISVNLLQKKSLHNTTYEYMQTFNHSTCNTFHTNIHIIFFWKQDRYVLHNLHNGMT